MSHIHRFAPHPRVIATAIDLDVAECLGQIGRVVDPHQVAVQAPDWNNIGQICHGDSGLPTWANKVPDQDE